MASMSTAAPDVPALPDRLQGMPDPSTGPGTNNEHAAQAPLRVDHILWQGDEPM